MMKYFISAVIFTLIFGAALAQTAFEPRPCGHFEAEQEIRELYPEAIPMIEKANAELEARAREMEGKEQAGPVYIIPVVFHIIHLYGVENISDAQVQDAVSILNRDFRKWNADTADVVPDFRSRIADSEIEFRLAQRDPNGNCTSGITRTVSDLTLAGNQQMKNLIQWDRSMYLNIWVCVDANGAAGYTQYPGSVSAPQFAIRDGIVIRHDYTGSIGTGAVHTSRALTHEVGHWINLPHCWGNSNNPGLAGNCSDDDGVGDTPNTIGWTSCKLDGESCSSLDNVQNYMEYSYCCRMFTNGQASRMRASLTSTVAGRSNLWSPSNLAATGTDGNHILCVADFRAEPSTVCEGGQVKFLDQSYHGQISWDWNFPGGNPSTSADQYPTVIYNTPGIYDVTLVVTNGIDQRSSTKVGYIVVAPDKGYTTPFMEGFETSQVPGTDWQVVNHDGSIFSWETITGTGFDGNNSVRVSNYGNVNDEVDELLSPAYDVTGLVAPRMTWKSAYVRRNTDDDDRLKLYMTRDCGRSWALKKTYEVGDLESAPMQNTPFVPASKSEWLEYSLPITPAFITSHFKFKFVFQSGGGNYLYVDNINIDGSVGLEKPEPAAHGVSVYPNPASAKGSLRLVWTGSGRSQANLEIMDPAGRILLVTELPSAGGANSGEINLKGLSAGFYVFRTVIDGKTFTNRVVLAE